MTIGTATVASTNVRSTLGRPARRSPRARLRTVRVGNTATQIMSASWCLVGGGTCDMVLLLRSGVGLDRGSGRQAGPEVVDGTAYVVRDEVVVDGDGRRGALAGGGDDLGARVDGVAGD